MISLGQDFRPDTDISNYLPVETENRDNLNSDRLSFTDLYRRNKTLDKTSGNVQGGNVSDWSIIKMYPEFHLYQFKYEFYV